MRDCITRSGRLFNQIGRSALGSGLIILLSATASAQINLVHVTSCGPATFPGTSCTIPASGAGNLIVVGWQIGGGASTTTIVTGVSDNAGNVYAEAGAARAIDIAAGSVTDLWYAKNSVPGSTSITITPNATISNGGAVIWEFSGVNATAPLDQTAVLNSQPSTTMPSGAPISATTASEVVISLAAVSGNITGVSSGNPFSNDSTLKGNGWAHLITTSPGTSVAQWIENPGGTFVSSTASFKAASAAVASACDLNGDAVVDVVDVQRAVNMSLGFLPCTANIEGVGNCNSDVVGRVITAALGELCVTGTGGTGVPHSVTLNWTASASAGIIGYNVYQGATSGGPYAKITPSLIAGTTFTDTTIQPGMTYYYVATAVNSSQVESLHSAEVQAVVPYP